MSVKPGTTTSRSKDPPRGCAIPPDATSPLVAEVLDELKGDSPRQVAIAPGRLDVMGGLSDYTGALVLNIPVPVLTCVAVQRNGVGELSVISAGASGPGGHDPVLIETSTLWTGGTGAVDAATGRDLVAGGQPEWARCVVGAIVEMVRAKWLKPFDHGLSIAVSTPEEGRAHSGCDAALVAASMVAVAGAFDVTLDSVAAAKLCQRVEQDWLGLPVGIADAVCVLLGESNTIAQIRCEPCGLTGSILIPDSITVVGIDCGACHPQAKLKYELVRTAAYMGRGLMERIIQHDGLSHLQWEGYLSRITVTDYVDRFRDRIPTKLKGSEYLQRFGESGDPLTRIDPSYMYKIRSRTEHHIYEHARACEFAQALSRAIRNGNERGLVEAGELMYASHWSYGQRCGLGSVETDALVNLIRSRGADAGVFGAKITARGAGGVVVVLMRNDDVAMAALQAAIDAYEAKTNRKTSLIRGSASGAMVTGVFSG